MRILRNIFSSIRQYKLSALLNIVGLAVSFTAAYCMMLPLLPDFLYNSEIKDCERVFRVETRLFDEGWSLNIPRGLSEAILRNSPCVQSHHTAVALFDSQLIFAGNEADGIYLNVATVTQGMAETFGINLLSGSWENLLLPDRIAFSRSRAEKSGIKTGDKAVVVKDKMEQPCTVAAIFEDFPENSDFNRLEALHGTDAHPQPMLFVKLHSRADKKAFIEGVVAQLPAFADILTVDYKNIDKGNIDDYVRLVSLDETLFAGSMPNHHADYGSYGRQADKFENYKYWATVALILFVAFINYFNFFIALVPQRIRRVNIQKIMGARAVSLRVETILESVIIVLVAFLVALFIIELYLPYNVYGRYMEPSLLNKWGLGAASLLGATVIVVAALSAVYPAFFLTSFPPAFTLKGNFATNRYGRILRNILLAVQFFAAFIFTTPVLLLYAQWGHMNSMNMGVNKKIYTYNLYGASDNIADGNKRTELRNAFLTHEGVEEVSFTCAGSALNISAVHGITNIQDGVAVNMAAVGVDYNYTDIMDIDIIDGRGFCTNDRDGRTYGIINEKGRRQYGIQPGDNLQAASLPNGCVIVGVCEDFKLNVLLDTPPLLLTFDEDESYLTALIKLKKGADRDSVAEFIRSTHKKHEVCKEWKEALFLTEEELIKDSTAGYTDAAKLEANYSFVVIITLLLGLFGIVRFEMQYRRKEIALRRIHGATCSDILRHLNGRYLKILLLAFVFSLPVSYMQNREMFDSFVERTPLYHYVYFFVFILVALFVVAIISLSAWRTLRENPAEVVKENR